MRWLYLEVLLDAMGRHRLYNNTYIPLNVKSDENLIREQYMGAKDVTS